MNTAFFYSKLLIYKRVDHGRILPSFDFSMFGVDWILVCVFLVLRAAICPDDGIVCVCVVVEEDEGSTKAVPQKREDMFHHY